MYLYAYFVSQYIQVFFFILNFVEFKFLSEIILLSYTALQKHKNKK